MKHDSASRRGTHVGRVRALVASSPKKERLFFSGYVNRTAGAAIAVLAEPTDVTPNQITVAGLAVHAAAAGVLILADLPIAFWPWLTVLLLWQLAFSLDAADGQLARLSGKGTAFGAWLDTLVDVVTHVMVYGVLVLFVVRALDLDGPIAAVLTSVVLGSHLVQLLTGWRHDVLGSDPAVSNPPAWLATSMRARHLLDYGWFLFATAALLPWPSILMAYLLASSAFHALAAVIQLSLNWYRELTDDRTTRASSIPRR